MPPPGRRPRVRVSLRGLMLLVALVALGVGWFVNAARSQRAAVAAVAAAGGSVGYADPEGPGWLRRRLGDGPFRAVNRVYLNRLADPAVLAAVARFDRLEALYLTHSVAVASGLHPLRGLAHLRTVKLQGPGVTDATLADLAALGSIQSLELDATAATDAGIARLLVALPRLREFDLGPGPTGLALTSEALARHHPGLARLELAGSAVGDADLAAVGRIAGLRELDLARTAITDAGLTHLRPLSGLTRLVLAGVVGLTDAGLPALAALAALADLDLGTTYVGDAGLAALEPLARLRRLDLSATDVTDAGLPALARLPGLVQLILVEDARVTDAGLPALSQAPSLLALDVTRTGVTRPRPAFPGRASRRGFILTNTAWSAPWRRLPPRALPPTSPPR